MSQTEAGASKTAATNKRNHGKDYYRKLGALGGKAEHAKPRGFAAMSPERVKEASIKGYKARAKKKLMG